MDQDIVCITISTALLACSTQFVPLMVSIRMSYMNIFIEYPFDTLNLQHTVRLFNLVHENVSLVNPVHLEST